MDILLKYFPDLPDDQQAQFAQLDELYRYWNERINVISRKDIDQLYLHHVLHSLAIVKLLHFVPGARILDLGTGGGFPGIPLAIVFPETEFLLVDARAKKIKVVNAVAEALGLSNLQARHQRVEEIKKERFDFIVTRAVAPLPKLLQWSQRLIKEEMQHALPNGLIALKGGDLKAEIKGLPRGNYVDQFPINEFFAEPYFEEKQVVYVQG